MKKYAVLFILLLLFKFSEAQRFEAGAFIGGNNLISDVGRDYYMVPNSVTIGALFKWNKHERLAYRANVYYSFVNGAGESRFDYSQPHFYNGAVGSGELMLEWNFYDYNLRRRNAATPYMTVGLGSLIYQKIRTRNEGGDPQNSVMVNDDYGMVAAIPFGLGYKMKIGGNFVVAADLLFRYSFSDNLDYSKTKQIGNLNSNDWLTTLGITITYIFGRDPCACGQ